MHPEGSVYLQLYDSLYPKEHLPMTGDNRISAVFIFPAVRKYEHPLSDTFLVVKVFSAHRLLFCPVKLIL